MLHGLHHSIFFRSVLIVQTALVSSGLLYEFGFDFVGCYLLEIELYLWACKIGLIEFLWWINPNRRLTLGVAGVV